ncbi:myelin-oligodendrocyte glyco isoform X2 [Labeo rohita]|uniref:Myelin-oligodendrocyte glyco isoform X2 n=1 Tax=Labeo rohita TaxID=84645 RepID=A0A498M7K1_LABRO|nr:myelin-oligodendrocyte glyco isoform X2 [Labeo rohita]
MFRSPLSTGRADINVKAMAGQAASLPCKCPPDWPPYLVWQKVTSEKPLVVNYYKDDNQEDEQTAPEYRNRTELNLTGNCSLVFHRVRLSDRGLYECYYKTTPLRHEKIHLDITEQQQQMPKPDPNVQSLIVTSSVCGLLFIALTIAAVYVGITCRNRHQAKRAFIATPVKSI